MIHIKNLKFLGDLPDSDQAPIYHGQWKHNRNGEVKTFAQNLTRYSSRRRSLQNSESQPMIEAADISDSPATLKLPKLKHTPVKPEKGALLSFRDNLPPLSESSRNQANGDDDEKAESVHLPPVLLGSPSILNSRPKKRKIVFRVPSVLSMRENQKQDDSAISARRPRKVNKKNSKRRRTRTEDLSRQKRSSLDDKLSKNTEKPKNQQKLKQNTQTLIKTLNAWQMKKSRGLCKDLTSQKTARIVRCRSKLGKGRYSKLVTLFQLIDDDEGGTISVEETAQLNHQVNQSIPMEQCLKDAQLMFRFADNDGSGEIPLDQWLHGWTTTLQKNPERNGPKIDLILDAFLRPFNLQF